MTSEESIKAAVEHVGVEEGRLDVLVNNVSDPSIMLVIGTKEYLTACANDAYTTRARGD